MTEATPPRRVRQRALSYPDEDDDGSMPQRSSEPMLVRRNTLPANDKHALVKRISIGSPLPPEKPAADDDEKRAFSFGRDVFSPALYGLINAVIGLPALYGYAAVIFAHPVFQPLKGVLAKSVVVSSAVHQLVFVLLSTLPFAIGQVQDAGLIFLGKMAKEIADALDGEELDDIVATTLAGLCGATALLGLCVVCVGRARLSWLVGYLPMPVLGGYLAFIGWFCIEAGISLCIGLCIGDVIDGPTSLYRMWSPPWRLALAAPGLLGGYALSSIASNDTTGAKVPLAMLAMPLAFYLVIAILPNYSLDDARKDGWMYEEDDDTSASFADLISLYDFKRVHWSVIPSIAPVWAAMVIIVAFSSCLDVAAIEMDLGRPLDMDGELTTVGISNTVAGLLGGFTGSYIFSQTIFTCRSGCRSRIVGVVVVVCELVAGVTKLDLLGALPLFFFAATLAFVGFDLVHEWLVESHKLFARRSEYYTLLSTFVLIQALGLVPGLVAGCGVASIDFMVEAVGAATPVRVDRQSLALRTRQQKAYLRSRDAQRIVFELRGTIWWGSASTVLQRVKQALAPALNDGEARSLLATSRGETNPWHVILDGRRVAGLDASAVRACFVPLGQLATMTGIGIAVGGLPQAFIELLDTHGARAAGLVVFPTCDEALRWAEERQLQAAARTGALQPAETYARRESAPQEYEALSPEGAAFLARSVLRAPDAAVASTAQALAPFRSATLADGEPLFVVGDESDVFYCVVSGQVHGRPQSMDDSGSFLDVTSVQDVFGPGAFVGYVDHVSGRSRRWSCVAGGTATVAVLSRETMEAVAATDPAVQIRLQQAIIEYAAAELSNV